MFEKRVLRRIFGPKRDEETGGWRELHYEELHNLYSSPSVMVKSRMKWIWRVARMGITGMHIEYWRERPLRRPGRRWDDNIDMELREIKWGGMNCTDLAEDGDQLEPSGSMNCWEILE
jgi:hypothetical protein